MPSEVKAPARKPSPIPSMNPFFRPYCFINIDAGIRHAAVPTLITATGSVASALSAARLYPTSPDNAITNIPAV